MTNYEHRAYDMLAKQLTEAGYSYQDTSWSNDATASLSVTCSRVIGDKVKECEFQIYIPNSDYSDMDNEYFNTYAVTDKNDDTTVDLYQAVEVVKLIKTITQDF